MHAATTVALQPRLSLLVLLGGDSFSGRIGSGFGEQPMDQGWPRETVLQLMVTQWPSSGYKQWPRNTSRHNSEYCMVMISLRSGRSTIVRPDYIGCCRQTTRTNALFMPDGVCYFTKDNALVGPATAVLAGEEHSSRKIENCLDLQRGCQHAIQAAMATGSFFPHVEERL